MSIRLYPDFITSVDVMDSIRWIKSFTKSDFSNIESSKKILSRVVVYVDGLVSRQKSFLNSGIANTFIGYNNSYWSYEDYKKYLDCNRSYFICDPEDDSRYTLNVETILKLCKVSELPNRMYHLFLNQGVYEERILQKFGLI